VGTSRLIAKGVERVEPVTVEVAAKSHNWMEQRLVIRSCPLAQAGRRGLRARLAKAPAPVMALNKRGRGQRRCTDPSAMWEVVDALRASDRVQGLLDVRYSDIRHNGGSPRCGATPTGTPACGWSEACR
jgi:hypothetical protein